MNESFKNVAEQLEGLKELTRQLPEIMERALGGLNAEDQIKAKEFKGEADRIAKMEMNFAEKMNKLQELRNRYGNSDNSK